MKSRVVQWAELLRLLFFPPALAYVAASVTPAKSFRDVFLPLSCPGCIFLRVSEWIPSPGMVYHVQAPQVLALGTPCTAGWMSLLEGIRACTGPVAV